jgi:pimeloyl-ACP methyl ester carboxylesterase
VSEATLLTGFRPHFAEIGGCRIRWFERGEGELVVLVHGLGGAASNWTLLGPSLAEGRRVLVVDLPGHGGSAPPPRNADLRTYAGVLAELLERQEASPAAVVGHSMGGLVAMRLAASRPDLVHRLVLFETAGIRSLSRSAAVFLVLSGLVRPAKKVARLRHRVAATPKLRRLVFGYWGAADPARMPAEAVLGWLEGAAAATDTATAGRALLRDDPRFDLGAVACPTLVVWGARDRLLPVADGFEFARRLRAPIRVVPGAGHLVIGERPEDCLAILEEFLGLSNRVGQVHELPLDAELVRDPG